MSLLLRLVYFAMPAAILLAFLWAPPVAVLGETGRIIYFHVPSAWVSVLAFLAAGIFSVIYIAKPGRYSMLDSKAENAVLIGIIFTIVTLVSGSVWAKLSWGSFWNWDPRQTSIVILLLVYVAYISLRSSLADNPSIGRISSAYLVFALFLMPLFIFVVPRIYPSLHPDPIINPGGKVNLDSEIQLTLLVSMFAFTLLFFYLWSLTNRVSELRRQVEENKYEL